MGKNFLASLFLNPNSFNFAYIFKNITTKWYFYVICLAFIILIAFSLFLIKGNKQNALTKTQKIAYTAVLSAICFIANALTFSVGELFQISLIATFGFIAGCILGPGLGFTAAFIGDFLCAIILPKGPYSPIINFGTALWGYIAGIIFTCFKWKTWVKILVGFTLGFILNSFCINTVGLALMYQAYTFEQLLIELPFKFIVVVINAFITYGLVSVLPRILPKGKFNI